VLFFLVVGLVLATVGCLAWLALRGRSERRHT
jgi:hypothetical protein